MDPGFPADAAKEGLVFLDGLVGPSLVQPTAHIGSALYSLLQAEADIFAFIPQETHSSSPMFHALVEFCDVEASVAIVNRFNNFTADVNNTCPFSRAHFTRPRLTDLLAVY